MLIQLQGNQITGWASGGNMSDSIEINSSQIPDNFIPEFSAHTWEYIGDKVVCTGNIIAPVINESVPVEERLSAMEDALTALLLEG